MVIMMAATEGTMPTASNSDLRDFFEQELGELLDGLYGAALRLAKHQADAEDLVAETVTKALDNLDTLKDRKHLRSWMFRILTNTYISEWRKRGARPQTEVLQEDDDEAEFSLFDKLHQPFYFGGEHRSRSF